MDLHLPVLDGIETTRQLKSMEHTKNIPVVAMSADAIEGVRENCLNAGMDDYISKPIDPEHFYSILSQYLTMSQAEKHAPVTDKLNLPAMTSVDIQEGLHRLNENKALYVKLLQRFFDTYKTFDEALQIARERESSKELHTLFHTLKGVAGNIGAKELFDVTREIVIYIKKHDATPDQNQMDHFYTRLKTVISEVEACLQGIQVETMHHDNKNPAPAGEKQFWNDCNALIRYLEDNDTTAIAFTSQMLVRYTDHPAWEDLKRIRKVLDNYDFTAACETAYDILHLNNKTD